MVKVLINVPDVIIKVFKVIIMLMVFVMRGCRREKRQEGGGETLYN